MNQKFQFSFLKQIEDLSFGSILIFETDRGFILNVDILLIFRICLKISVEVLQFQKER